MKRSIIVVLVLMAAIAVYGTERSAQSVSSEARFFGGPVCLPGDPCGPDAARSTVMPNVLEIEKRGGPVCYPGDPCGAGGRPELQVASDSKKFGGPVCYPGDPCGPSGTQ
ncbi:MAG TPA: hypothetical protein VI685_05055 [Candidatus Angelobacter sp.]